MKIQTFSIVVGGSKCNAKCPYCVSKMTGDDGLCECKVKDINTRNFRKACLFAKQSGVSTVLLTGKGEPLLYPDFISAYLQDLKEHDFPFIELQTNGISLGTSPKMLRDTYLETWYDAGLTTICLSCAHWIDENNKQIFGKNYDSLKRYIDICHNAGFSVRVSCVMAKGHIDDLYLVKSFAETCKIWGVEQFTTRPVTMPDECFNKEVENWTKEHLISPIAIMDMSDFFSEPKNATLLLELAHGAKVYDYNGQNISINSCLTHSPNPDDIRQLIFFSDGHLRFSWTHKGAIII